MELNIVTSGEIVRGIKGQYSGKAYVVVDRKNVFMEQGYPEMPEDYEPDLNESFFADKDGNPPADGSMNRREFWRLEQRRRAAKEGRYFLYTLKNKDSTIKVWSYLLIGAEGKQPSFERVAVDELTKNNAIARRRKETENNMKRFKFNTNMPYDKDKWSYDKWSAGSNA